ncbi:MAG: sensor histidine kinase [Arachnia sp.]
MSLVERTDLEWLDAFVEHWHLLADLSFSDLLLWLPREDGARFECIAQVRPVTGPTALEDDVTGETIWHEPDHPVVVAFMSQEITETSDNALGAGIPVDVRAVPIMREGVCIAVLERHTNQMGVRAPGVLEESFTEVADVLTAMLHDGNFPLPMTGDKALEPRVGDGMERLQSDGIVSYASPNAVTAFRRLGYDGDITGENFSEIIKELRTDVESVGQTLLGDLSAGRSTTFDLERSRASMRFVLFPLHIGGVSWGTLVLSRDTTDLRSRDRMLVTKDATIREIHHRVKNNLQTVAALLRMQARRVQSPDCREALSDATRRVSSIALVHDTLSHSVDEDVLFDDVVDRILAMVGDVAAASGQVTVLRVGSFGRISGRAATSLGMVITELCQNAVEHGLNGGSGRVEVQPQRADDGLVVDVLDDGQGLPEGFSVEQQTSLGLAIISTLVGDLGGSLRLTNRDNVTGARARLRLPVSVLSED